jgi:hypothetical protein
LVTERSEAFVQVVTDVAEHCDEAVTDPPPD